MGDVVQLTVGNSSYKNTYWAREEEVQLEMTMQCKL